MRQNIYLYFKIAIILSVFIAPFLDSENTYCLTGTKESFILALISTILFPIFVYIAIVTTKHTAYKVDWSLPQWNRNPFMPLYPLDCIHFLSWLILAEGLGDLCANLILCQNIQLSTSCFLTLNGLLILLIWNKVFHNLAKVK